MNLFSKAIYTFCSNSLHRAFCSLLGEHSTLAGNSGISLTGGEESSYFQVGVAVRADESRQRNRSYSVTPTESFVLRHANGIVRTITLQPRIMMSKGFGGVLKGEKTIHIRDSTMKGITRFLNRRHSSHSNKRLLVSMIIAIKTRISR